MSAFNTSYNIIYGLLALITFIFATTPKLNKNEKLNIYIIVLFSIMYMILFGTRSFNVGTDTGNYLGAIRNNKEFTDIGFNTFIAIVQFISKSERFLLISISFLFMFPLCLYFSKITNENKLLLFFIFVSLFSFKNLGINIIKQGISIAIFLLSTYYFDKKKNLPAILLSIIAFSFQSSILIPTFFYLISRKIKSIIIPLIILIISTILAISNFDFYKIIKSIPIINSWSIIMDRLYRIVNITDGYYRTGFRLDFFVFNLFFAILGIVIYKKAIIIFPNYKIYLSVYYFTSSIFFLMFKYPFSDRFGLFSWIFIPFLFIPYIQKEGVFNKYGSALSFLLMFTVNIFMTIWQN